MYIFTYSSNFVLSEEPFPTALFFSNEKLKSAALRRTENGSVVKTSSILVAILVCVNVILRMLYGNIPKPLDGS